MSETLALKRGDLVRSERFEGIALWFVGYARQSLDCPERAVGGYCDCDDDFTEDRETAEVVMVGDDQVHQVPTASLTPIERSDFCAGCGQTGCHHNREE